jgi:hypothetical protein
MQRTVQLSKARYIGGHSALRLKGVRYGANHLVFRATYDMTNKANHDEMKCKATKSFLSEFIQPGLHKNQTV